MDQDLRLMPSSFFDRLDCRFIKTKDHRRQLLDVLCNTIVLNSPGHDDLQRFDELLEAGLPKPEAPHFVEPAVQSYLACLLIATVWPSLIHQDFASIQPMRGEIGVVNFLAAEPVGNDGTRLQFASCKASVKANEVQATLSTEVLIDLTDLFFHLARELSLELNIQVLAKLAQEVSLVPANLKTQGADPAAGWSSDEWDAQASEFFNWAALDLFRQRHGGVTHLFGGGSVLFRLLKPTYPTPHALKGIEVPSRAGLTELHHVSVPGYPQMRTYRVGGWRQQVEQEQLLLARRGSDHVADGGKVVGDAAVIWAPYAARCSFNNDTQGMTFGISAATFVDPSNAQLVRTRYRS